MKKLIHVFLICLLAIPLAAQGIGGKTGLGGKAGIGGKFSSTQYYGYGCTATATNTCTVASSTGSSFGFLVGTPVTMGSNAAGYTVNACGKDFNGSASGNFICAIYDNNGSSSPVSGCTASSGVAEASGWVENTNFSGCTLAASTTYKVVFQVSFNGGNNELQDSSGTNYFVASTYPTFASGVTWASQSVSRSQYVRVTAN